MKIYSIICVLLLHLISCDFKWRPVAAKSLEKDMTCKEGCAVFGLQAICETLFYPDDCLIEDHICHCLADYY